MATFPSINPSYSVIESVSFNTQIIGYGNKVEQRIALDSIGRKGFKLQWTSLSPADKSTIKDFFIARLGAFDAFTWTNPLDSIAYNVRFQEDMLNAEYFDYLLWDINQVEFIEVS